MAEIEVGGWHKHFWERRQNVTTKGYKLPPYEACECGAARTVDADPVTTSPPPEVAAVLAAHRWHDGGYDEGCCECFNGRDNYVPWRDYYDHLAERLTPVVAGAAERALRDAAVEVRHIQSRIHAAAYLTAEADRLAALTPDAEVDPYDRPVFVQGHNHSEPVCAWPDCETYLTREQMAELQAGAEVDRG